MWELGDGVAESVTAVFLEEMEHLAIMYSDEKAGRVWKQVVNCLFTALFYFHL